MINSKIYRAGLALFLLISLVLAGCGGSKPAQEAPKAADKGKQFTMKLGSVEAVEALQNKATLRFKESVEKATNGNVKVEVFPASQLGNARAQIEATQLNTQQGVLLPNSNFVGFYPSAAITDLPFLFPSRDAAYKVMDGAVGAEYMKGYEKAGLKTVALFESGFKQFTGNFPIKKPEDFKGKKIRVMENPVLIAQYEAMGAGAVPINFAELYNSLQQGVVDGQENPLSTINNMKFYEVQKYMAVSDHGWLPLVMSFNKGWFDGLPKEYQDAIVKAAGESRDWLRQELKKTEQDVYIPAFKKAGVNVVELSAEERAAFSAKVKDPTRAKLMTLLDDQGKAMLNKIDTAIKEAK